MGDECGDECGDSFKSVSTIEFYSVNSNTTGTITWPPSLKPN